MISIIIPVYNGAEWLAEAIESALNQTKKVYEIIVVNDGSTDNSLEVAQRYPVTIINQVNKGLASARNTGLMNTAEITLEDTLDFSEIGKAYCLFLDADDILLPNAVERILETIKQNPDADIICPSFREFGLGNREVILMPNPTLEDFRTGNRVGYCAAIRRSVLLEVGGYSPRMTWGAEDLHLWINLLTKGFKISTIPDILWMYRLKETSMWTETQKHKTEFLAQINKDFPNVKLEF